MKSRRIYIFCMVPSQCRRGMLKLEVGRDDGLGQSIIIVFYLHAVCCTKTITLCQVKLL